MEKWKDTRLTRCPSLARVIGTFRVTTPRQCPFRAFKIQVVELRNGGYAAYPNVCPHDDSGHADWICGTGTTAESALQDAIVTFEQSIRDDQMAPTEFSWWSEREF